MSNYGIMTGYDDAIEWIKVLQLKSPKDQDIRDRVVERMRYEHDKAKPVKPNLYKADKRAYSYYKCGHCGQVLRIIDNYCANCGFKIDWASTRCLT